MANEKSARGPVIQTLHETLDKGPPITNPFWYKDAIIYQVHIKSYFDSNGDGYGDFAGLCQKLEYIRDLGVDCIWLLPFYRSPLRDDGYDIADYTGVNPVYGDKNDFREFLNTAHSHGLKVITELVINHTSDEHPWFQASRRAPAGSKKRDWYVWSDTDELYKDARIIFLDSEKSNWTWDPIASAFYWHRFFYHQPDLNFDNPSVIRALVRVMRYWLDMGIDGLRLDAIPYLIERDGTNCENLPETHDVLKLLRSKLDEKYQNRVFLAEANQWPIDVIPYFGDSNECHMAFHFPIMPRLYIAIGQEDSRPIIEILKQTPDIPHACQWAIFLRNHDELTLEMVTESEREYMYNTYAPVHEMRINLGIRRRLAPLMNYSRPRIELMNALLFSLPGTPIVYYGDEIGMGENYNLPDRNGVRTPMQWNGDINGGFSAAPQERLYSPVIGDPICGFKSVNVEAQELNPSSLLNWMRAIIAVRRKFKVFGRGSLEIVNVDNHKVLAFLRKYESETILVVINFAASPQSAHIDLSAYQKLVPREIFGDSSFPQITADPYLLTLGPYGFYWLDLSAK